MAIRKILRMGHPLLREVSKPVAPAFVGSDDFERLLDDMVDTLHDYGGIGLAAPQIGEMIRLAIIQIPGGETRYGRLSPLPLSIFINPTIEVIDPATARDERVAAGRVLLVAGGRSAIFDDGVSRKHAHAVLVSRCGVVRCGRAILSCESETRRFARTLDAASGYPSTRTSTAARASKGATENATPSTAAPSDETDGTATR